MSEYHALQASQVMSRSLISATPEQDLWEVEATLIEHRISGLPVVRDGHLVGVLSRSDIGRVQVLMNSLDGAVTDAERWGDQADGFQHNPRPEFHGFRQLVSRLKVKDAMHDQVVTCQPTTPLSEVADTMVRQHVHRVIVVEGDRPVGIISSLDIVKLLTRPSTESARS